MTNEPLPPQAAPADTPPPGTATDETEHLDAVSRPDDGFPLFDDEQSADVEAQNGEYSFNPEVADFQEEH